MPLPSSPSMRPLHALVAATLLAALPGCRSARVEAPAPAAAAGSRPMSWRVASAHLEDIFAEIPHSGIDDLRRDTPEAERLLVNAAHGEAGAFADEILGIFTKFVQILGFELGGHFLNLAGGGAGIVTIFFTELVFNDNGIVGNDLAKA